MEVGTHTDIVVSYYAMFECTVYIHVHNIIGEQDWHDFHIHNSDNNVSRCMEVGTHTYIVVSYYAMFEPEQCTLSFPVLFPYFLSLTFLFHLLVSFHFLDAYCVFYTLRNILPEAIDVYTLAVFMSSC